MYNVVKPKTIVLDIKAPVSKATIGTGYSLKPKIEVKPEFLVSDEFGNFFCMYKDGYPHWSPKISEARELTEDCQFDTLVRWEKGIRKLKKEYL